MHRCKKDNRKDIDFPGLHKGGRELQRLKQIWHNNVMNEKSKRRATTQAHRPGAQQKSEISRLQNW
eukprot:10057228-Heterocapsa_arctica.AAC.1